MEPSDLQLLKVTIAYYRAANDLMMAKINEQDTVLKKIFGDLDPGIRNIIAENVKGIRIVNTTAEKMANRLLGQLSHDPESSKNGVERYTGMAMQKLEQKAMDKVNSARSVTASEGAQRQTHQEVEALNKRKKKQWSARVRDFIDDEAAEDAEDGLESEPGTFRTLSEDERFIDDSEARNVYVWPENRSRK